MFDQDFSTNNFRRIYDYENRKGTFLDHFFPEFAPLTESIKDYSSKIRVQRELNQANRTDNATCTKLSALYEQRAEIRSQKYEQLLDALSRISLEIALPTFSPRIRKGPEVRGKPVYNYGDCAATYFALKQIQYNIYRLYKVRQSNRHNIICQLRELLSDSFPKYVLRTDISAFYESVPRDRMLKQLAHDSLLTAASTRIIKRILWEYSTLSGNTKGIPRGIGISAYLAELYLRRFDEEIRRLPGVVHYARYVDDIILIYIPHSPLGATDLQDFIGDLFPKYGLEQNTQKTTLVAVDGKHNHTITYLGYQLSFGTGGIDISLSRNKTSRYKKRIDLVIDSYKEASTRHELDARRLLIKRLRFLTSNTRLVNNKRHARVGIYFSNSLLTNSRCLKCLDDYLEAKSQGISEKRVRNRLARISFQKGFDDRRFSRFTVKELSEIVRAWKYAEEAH